MSEARRSEMLDGVLDGIALLAPTPTFFFSLYDPGHEQLDFTVLHFWGKLIIGPIMSPLYAHGVRNAE